MSLRNNLHKMVLLRSILFFTITLLFVIKVKAQSKEVLQTEKKIARLEQLYQNGSYTEVLSEALKLSKNLKNSSDIPRHYYIHSKIYSLKAKYSTLEFENIRLLEAEISGEIETLSSPKDKALAYLYLTNYYNEIESSLKASEAHSKILYFRDTTDLKWRLTYEFEKVVFLIGQKNFIEAKQTLAKMEGMLNDSSMNINRGKNNYINHEKAVLINLKLLYSIRNGNYAEAEKQFISNKSWFSTIIQKSDPEYSRFIELQAALAWERQQYKKAYKLYQECYTTLTTSDYQQHKIYLLARITILSSMIGDVTGYAQYMRRLQLHADRNIYRNNSFQFVHGYVEAYSFFVKGKYNNSLLKLKKVVSKYPTMPANHFFRNLAYVLEEFIYEEDAQMVAYHELLDTLCSIAKLYKGENTPAFFETSFKRARASINKGDHSLQLEKKLQDSYVLCSLKVDSISNISCTFFELMANLYVQTDRFQQAKDKSNQAKLIAEVLYDSLSWEYTSVYIKNLEYCIWAGDYKEALKNYAVLPRLESYTRTLDNSFQYIRFHRAALTGKWLGDLNSSKTYSLRAIKLLESEPRKQRLVFSDIRVQAASTYTDVSNLFVAEKLLTQVLTLKKQKLGTSYPALLIVYKELIRLYILNGNFTQADKTITEYLKLSKSLYGESSAVYNEGVFLAGQYFVSIGNLTRAKENFESCLKVQRSLLGEQHLTVASTYLELAGVNVKLNPEKFILNEQTFQTAGTIIEATIGKENQLYAQYLQLLAEFYTSFSKYNEAEKMLKEANLYWESKLGSKNVHSADIAMLLGKIAYLKASYQEAELLYTKARELYGSIFSVEHPSYAAATACLAKVSYMLKDKEKSLSLMELCIPKYLAYVEKYFPSLSFQEKSKFWFSMKEEFEFYDFLVLSTLSDSKSKLNGNVYNTVIATKALLLSSDIKLRKQITSSGDTLLIRLFEEWLAQKELLTSIVSYSKEQLLEQGLDQRKIELTLESLEKEMSARSGLFQAETKKGELDWKDVQASLKPNEYAVEIIRYRFFDKVFKDSVIYAALILNNEMRDHPTLVVLPDGNKMETRYLKYYKNAVVFNMDDEYSYEAFWKPIKSKIPDNARIYLSSDGVYNQLNVEMFFNNTNGKFVLDENQLVQLTNTKDMIAEDLVRKGKNIKIEKGTGEIVLCGNPSFYVDFGKKKTIKSLPGAEDEVKGLKELLDKSGRKNLTLLNEHVTEDTLKSIKSPLALHVATHGYFKETEQNEAEDFGSNPLLNSGLMLSGSGNIVDGENTYVNSADGILTAYEVINMQLDNTEMVILSACETGKGQLKAGEGVYGLQRSFLVAGANCVVLSLFKVNDEVTKELMVHFYTNWLQTNDKRQSFVEAKKVIREKYKSPIYWGAFIMIEGKNQQKVITY